MSFLGVAVVEGTERERDEWNLAFLHFAPDHVYALGADTEWEPYRQPYTRVPTLASLVIPPGTKLVIFAPTNGEHVQGTESLVTFVHPEDALYVFGQDHQHFDPALLGGRTPDHLVYVPTLGDAQMHSYTAGLLMFYDRAVKRG